jgi:protease I
MKVLILSADDFEDAELLVPLTRLRAVGMQVDVASFAVGKIHGKRGEVALANRAIAAIRPDDYHALLLPGGKAPEALRRDAQALALVRHFFAAGKPVAAICHGPQVLISAGVMAGRTATAYRSVANELKAAGAHYRDAEVVVDDNLVTSRTPADLPAFVNEFISKLQSAAPTAAQPAP